jgi:Zn-dependent peptidase ImmA (M78 family)
MKDNSAQKLERLAKRLLTKYRVVSPPVPLEHLVEQMGADLRIASFDAALVGFYLAASEDGLKTSLICINSAKPRNMQRWALAHEMGHMILASHDIHIDWPDPQNRESPSETKSDDHQEILADQLAFELLLPRHMLVKDIKQPLNPHDDAPLKRLASRYRVSLYALISRLEQVRLLSTRSSSRKRVQRQSIDLPPSMVSGQT